MLPRRRSHAPAAFEYGRFPRHVYSFYTALPFTVRKCTPHAGTVTTRTQPQRCARRMRPGKYASMPTVRAQILCRRRLGHGAAMLAAVLRRRITRRSNAEPRTHTAECDMSCHDVVSACRSALSMLLHFCSHTLQTAIYRHVLSQRFSEPADCTGITQKAQPIVVDCTAYAACLF